MEYTEEYLNSIEEALEDKEFAGKVANASEKTEVIRLFAGKNIVIDAEAAQAMLDKLNKLKENDGELDPEDLELVSGGGKLWNKFKSACKTVANYAASTALGGTAGAFLVASAGVVGAAAVGSVIACGLYAYFDTKTK